MIDWLNANSGFVTAGATAIIAFSAVITTLLTWSLARDNRALRKAGTEPEVVAYLEIDARSGSLVNLVLENIGQGPACDVEFFVDADPKDFSAHEVMNVPARVHTKIARLIPQGGRRERMLALGFNLLKEGDALRPFSVKVSYLNLRGTRYGPRRFELDVSELGGALARMPAEERMADSLAKIEKHLGNYGSEMARLRVETSRAAERQAAEKARLGS